MLVEDVHDHQGGRPGSAHLAVHEHSVLGVGLDGCLIYGVEDLVLLLLVAGLVNLLFEIVVINADTLAVVTLFRFLVFLEDRRVERVLKVPVESREVLDDARFVEISYANLQVVNLLSDTDAMERTCLAEGPRHDICNVPNMTYF